MYDEYINISKQVLNIYIYINVNRNKNIYQILKIYENIQYVNVSLLSQSATLESEDVYFGTRWSLDMKKWLAARGRDIL